MLVYLSIWGKGEVSKEPTHSNGICEGGNGICEGRETDIHTPCCAKSVQHFVAETKLASICAALLQHTSGNAEAKSYVPQEFPCKIGSHKP